MANTLLKPAARIAMMWLLLPIGSALFGWRECLFAPSCDAWAGDGLVRIVSAFKLPFSGMVGVVAVGDSRHALLLAFGLLLAIGLLVGAWFMRRTRLGPLLAAVGLALWSVAGSLAMATTD
jgi:hypothetical protein